jgi:hypothetical protein
MRRIHALTSPLVLGALLATTPQLALGQDGAVIRLDARPGTEIQSDQLVELITKDLAIEFGTDMRPLSVKLRLELISREDGVIGKYESKAVKTEGGRTYPGSTFIRASNNPTFSAPGFGDRRKITIGRVVVINHEEQYIPKECEDVTHAVRVTLVSDSRLFYEPNKPINFVCLRVEG